MVRYETLKKQLTSSRSMTQGFGQVRLYDVYQAQLLLYALASSSNQEVSLRMNISHFSTTYFGNGSNFVNGVGNCIGN